MRGIARFVSVSFVSVITVDTLSIIYKQRFFQLVEFWKKISNAPKNPKQWKTSSTPNAQATIQS